MPNDQPTPRLDSGLITTTKPDRIILNEQAWHRLAALRKLEGATIQEIADQFGRNYGCVLRVLRQPHIRQLMVEEAAKGGRAKVDSFLEGEVLPSVMKLVEIRDDSAASKETQRKAAKDIVEMVRGTPTARVEHTSKTDPNTLTTEELMEIAARGREN